MTPARGSSLPDRVGDLAVQVIDAIQANGATVAVAESLTGGLVCAALTSVPGASAVVRGGVVAYATDLKATLLAVDDDLLARHGPVDAQVAQAMAAGVARLCTATYGLATTGVAGPDPQGGVSVGTVYVAVDTPVFRKFARLDAHGSREEIRKTTVRAALELLLQGAREHSATLRR